MAGGRQHEDVQASGSLHMSTPPHKRCDHTAFRDGPGVANVCFTNGVSSLKSERLVLIRKSRRRNACRGPFFGILTA